MLAEYEYKQRFEQVFQLFSSGLIFISDEGEVLDANPYIEKVLEIEREKLLKMNSNTLLNMFSSQELLGRHFYRI